MKIRSILEKFFKTHSKKLQTLNNISIFKQNIIYNYKYLKEINKNCDIWPVLKSNAYWHWLEEISSFLDEINPGYVVVDSYYEALKILKHTKKTKILLIWYNILQNYDYFNFEKIDVVVYDLETLKKLWSLNKNINIHLKIDSWMSRQWIFFQDLDEFLKVLGDYKKINLVWVCTHLSDSDNYENDFSLEQLNYFKKCINFINEKNYFPKYIHASNTSWNLKNNFWEYFNTLRLWIWFYGINTLDPKDEFYEIWKKLKLSLSLDSTLVVKKSLQAWAKVGYNCSYTMPCDWVIWVLSLWYYEALPRSLKDYYLNYNWKKIKIIWKICMNLTIVDLTWVDDAKVWDKINIISNNINDFNNIYNFAKKSNTIPYENLVKLSESIRREVK